MTLEKKLRLAGFHQKRNYYYSLKYTTIIMLVLIVWFLLGYIVAGIAFLLFLVGYDYFLLDRLIKERSQEFDEQGLYFFEILVLTLAANHNLDQAIQITCNNVNSEFSQKFEKVLLEVSFGKTFEEAIHSLQTQIPSANINNILLSLSDTSAMGVKIIDVLEQQNEQLRKKIFLQKKAEINKIPIKISIVSVLIILPLILLLILSPLFIRFMV